MPDPFFREDEDPVAALAREAAAGRVVQGGEIPPLPGPAGGLSPLPQPAPSAPPDYGKAYDQAMAGPAPDQAALEAARGQKLSFSEVLPYLMYGLTRKNPGDAIPLMMEARNAKRSADVSAIEGGRKSKIQDYLNKKHLARGEQEMTKGEMEISSLKRAQQDAQDDRDPQSQRSLIAQQTVTRVAPKFSAAVQGKSADEIKSLLPWVKNQVEFDQAKALKQMEIGGELKKAELVAGGKAGESDKRFIPSIENYAATEKDASDAKDIDEVTKNVNALIDQALAIRKKAGPGGEIWNRDLVKSGNQIHNSMITELRKLASIRGVGEDVQELISEIAPNPTEIEVRGALGGNDNVADRLRNLKQIMEDKRRTFYESRGLMKGKEAAADDPSTLTDDDLWKQLMGAGSKDG